MLMLPPDFIDSPYVVDDDAHPGLHFRVTDDAPADERRRLETQIRKWERALRELDARRIVRAEGPSASDADS